MPVSSRRPASPPVRGSRALLPLLFSALLVVPGCASGTGGGMGAGGSARRPAPAAGAATSAASAARASSGAATPAEPPMSGDTLDRLPTGARLDPVGRAVDLGNFPLRLALSPNGRYAAVLLDGWHEQGVQIVDRSTGRVTQTLPQRAAFIGLKFGPNGRMLYASGGNQDVIYRYAWRDGRATLRDSLVLNAPVMGQEPPAGQPTEARHRARTGVRYPAGLAFSPDGGRLYVAENLGDSLAVVDLATGRVAQRLPAGRYPYDVAVAADGTVYVSAWGGHTVSVYAPAGAGDLKPAGHIYVGRHPSDLLLSHDGSRLFVASASTDRVIVVDTRARRVLTQLLDPPPAGPAEGSTPNALALSPDGTRLYAAEADANAVAVFHLSPMTAGVPGAMGDDRLAGRIPVDWYPSALALHHDTLLVVSAKGHGTAPNPGLGQPGRPLPPTHDASYTLGQLNGTLRTVPLGDVARAALPVWTRRVAHANGWDRPRVTPSYPPFRHVVYIIKENRTYDQVLGDLPQGDGDTALVFFGRRVTPNHHALAERFGIFDRFFVNAEVSADGHNWSTAAYATDYLEKTVQSNYSGRGRSYDYEGTNRGHLPPDGDDVAAPANGYIWNLAQRAGITFRNYGEFVVPDRDRGGPVPADYMGDKPYLATHTDPDYPGFDLSIPDQHRADIYIRALKRDIARDSMPALTLMRLPNDHTAGGRVGAPTPSAYVADNDLALGRIVAAISHSPFWKSTVIFVLEDDAQNGPDHVDSHRSPLLVISPYNHGGVIHRFANTTDVLATISDILHLGHMSQFDYYGRPLRGIFSKTPDLRPYTALTPQQSLSAKNGPHNPGARDSRRLDLRFEDSSNDMLFNHILWHMLKPDRPYPETVRASEVELRLRAQDDGAGRPH